MKQKIYKELQSLANEMNLTVKETMMDVLFYYYDEETGYDSETIYNMLNQLSDEELFDTFYRINCDLTIA
ncbi:MAG: hypothetical protein Q4C49_13140 [Bacillota bacterium]|nr:hypothetical protein [Bacillota bacterium]